MTIFEDSMVSQVSVASVGSFHSDDDGEPLAHRCCGIWLRLAHAVVHSPGIVLCAWAAVFATSCCFAPSLLEEVRVDYVPEPGMPSFEAKKAFDRRFPGLLDEVVDSVLFRFEPSVSMWDRDPLLKQAAKGMDEALLRVGEEYPGLLAHVRSWQAGGAVTEVRGAFKSEDELSYLLQVTWDTSNGKRQRVTLAARDLLAAARGLDEKFGASGLEIMATGPNALTAAAQAQAKQDIGVHAIMFLPVAILVMHTQLKRWEMLPLPALCSLVAVVLCFAVGAVIARWQVLDTNVPTTMAFLSVALCIDWTFFLLARIREEESHGAKFEDAIVTALSRTGANVALSGLLIIVCSICMVIMPSAIASNSIGGVTAVLASLASCLTLLPACLAVLPTFFGGRLSGRGLCQSDHWEGLEERGAPLDPPTSERGGSDDDAPSPGRNSCWGFTDSQRLWYLWACIVTSFPCNVLTLLGLILGLMPATSKLFTYVPVVSDSLYLPPDAPAVLADEHLRKTFAGADFERARLYLLAEAEPGCSVKMNGYFGALCDAAQLLLNETSAASAASEAVPALRAADLRGVAFWNPTNTNECRCVPWRTEDMSVDEAYQAMQGNFTPSAHTLLTGESHHAVMMPADQFMYYRELYRQLWSMAVSPDEQASLLAVSPPEGGMSWPKFRLVDKLRALRPASWAERSGDCSGVRGWELSLAGIWYDYIMATTDRLPFAIGLACLVTTPFVAVSFWSALAPLKLLLTVIAPMTWVYGVAIWTFEDLYPGPFGPPPELHEAPGRRGLHWMVPCSSVMLLLSLALDYNVFYFGRAVEFRKAGVSDLESVRQGLASTGPVITCAGIIFALEFAGLLMSETALNRQGGFVVVVGVLLDTFVVRSCLMPAVLSLGASRNWWPAPMPPVAADDEVNSVLCGRRTPLQVSSRVASREDTEECEGAF